MFGGLYDNTRPTVLVPPFLAGLHILGILGSGNLICPEDTTVSQYADNRCMTIRLRTHGS